MKLANVSVWLLGLSLCFMAACGTQVPDQILVILPASEPDSQEARLTSLTQAAEAAGIGLDTLHGAGGLTEARLQQYAALALLGLDGNGIDYPQHSTIERFVQAGGGLLGIDAGAIAPYRWSWFEQVMALQPEPPLAAGQSREATITAVRHRGELPAAFQRDYDGGRVAFLQTRASGWEKGLAQALPFVLGERRLDYRQATALPFPEPERFLKQTYITDLNEPMELAILPDYRILFIQRGGEIFLHDPAQDSTRLLAKLPVHTKFEDGLLGLTLDLDFAENGWLYLFYSPPGDKAVQHVSRFTFKYDSLILASEKVLIEIPVQRETCCHSAGSLEFGPDGNLYIALGDDTSPFNDKTQPYNADGFAPQDERPGRGPFDAQKSSGNIADLRGAILRITPTDYGTYTIPEGNLFPKDGSQGAPELYVKGCRNPFRMAIDSRRGWLYWGDVGPDAGEDLPDRGPRGYDEINQAQAPGYYGWPFFVGNNYPYRDYDYTHGESGAFFDPQRPLNTSPHNYGPQVLPPARPAFIWYPYAESPDFPYVGQGGRNAMAGPTYYYDDFPGSEFRLPQYYHDKVIFYDWMRGWLLAATLNEDGSLSKLEPFLEQMDFTNLVDLELGPDGSLYALEYGSIWFSGSHEAQLSRIDYAHGNRRPVAQVEVEQDKGAVPFTVVANARQSYDFDKEDELQYQWEILETGQSAAGPEALLTLAEVGEYTLQLTVTDQAGAQSAVRQTLLAGNAPPELQLSWRGNRSFYWPDRPQPYAVTVTDAEDGTVSHQATISFAYLDQGHDETLIAQGHTQTGKVYDGGQLIAASTCQACHQPAVKSVGPSYAMLQERYQATPETLRMLGAKVINGGNGSWGENIMAAHPQLKPEEAEAMVAYMLNYGQEEIKPSLPPAGQLAFEQGKKGTYLFQVSFEDKGANGMPPIKVQETLRLRPATLQAEDRVSIADAWGYKEADGSYTMQVAHGSYLGFSSIDWRGLAGATLRARATEEANWTLELRQQSPEGPLLTRTEVPFSGGQEVIPLNWETPPQSEAPFFLVIKGEQGADTPGRVRIDWIRFLPAEKSL